MRVIEVLGPGCPRCEKTTAEIRAVADQMHMDAEIRHVIDPAEIIERGVLFSVPVVLVDGALVSRGKVPSRREIERRLEVGSVAGPQAAALRTLAA